MRGARFATPAEPFEGVPVMHPIDPQLAQLLQKARAAEAPDLSDVPLPIARAIYSRIMSTSAPAPEGVVVRDMAASGKLARLRLYLPSDSSETWPLVLWMHGGGFVMGTLDDYDAICRRLCIDARAAVLALDYRLAPEHPYPAAYDDASTLLAWAASSEGAAALGPRVDVARVSLAGDSAGAAIAIGTALRARDERGPPIAGLALAYPTTAGGTPGAYASWERHAEGPTLTLRTMRWFNQLTYGKTGHATDAYGAPVLASSLAGLPPTLLMLAALDPLRDEGMAFGARVMADGGRVTLVECHGLAHGFLAQGAAVEAAAHAQTLFGRTLGDLLRAG